MVSILRRDIPQKSADGSRGSQATCQEPSRGSQATSQQPSASVAVNPFQNVPAVPSQAANSTASASETFAPGICQM